MKKYFYLFPLLISIFLLSCKETVIAPQNSTANTIMIDAQNHSFRYEKKLQNGYKTQFIIDNILIYEDSTYPYEYSLTSAYWADGKTHESSIISNKPLPTKWINNLPLAFMSRTIDASGFNVEIVVPL